MIEMKHKIKLPQSKLRLSSFIVCFVLSFVALGELCAADFQSDIRPILSDKCFSCHGPGGKPKAGLRLDSFEEATDKSRRGGPGILPGDVGGSLVIQRIFSSDADEIMPPPDSHKKLSREEKNLIKEWIISGAEYQLHWSLLPVSNPKAPSAQDPEWNKNAIDQFVWQELLRNGKSPSKEADRRTLIRRLAFDLTGLPPSMDLVRRYAYDESPNAYEDLVDQFLSTPEFGEHMARYWLDLVRYGDTHGLHADDYREMYAYRDWIIRAFNENKPFDEFTIEQIAGDLLTTPTTDQLIASGFNRLHLSNSAGSALAEELYVNNVVDRVNAIGTVFLGLTIGCAQCHDHKYDPISQREYYQLFAFFNNLDGLSHTQRKKSPPPFISLPNEKQSQALADLDLKIIDAADNKKKLTELIKERAALAAKIPTTMVMRERHEIRPAYIYERGLYDQPGEKVKRGTPIALPPMSVDLPKNRFGFAQWLVEPNHPLTSRVAVNRIWQQFFGVGLVKTSEDFGSQGELPSHPALLDHLASRFIANDWDIKDLVKYIVTSRTYKQTSSAESSDYIDDPENRWLSRGPRFRLDAEMLRDQALILSGLLNKSMYGRSVKPPQPPGLWKSVALKASNTRFFVPDTGSSTRRRSIYTFWKRSIPPPAMTIFDAPTREVCIARRERTNTPLQALVLMNEPQFFESAIAIARDVINHHSSDSVRLEYAWEKVTGYLIDPTEYSLLSKSLAQLKEQFSMRQEMRMGGEIVSPELASWSMLMNSLLNLDIVKTKP